jgi:hypothetical protein
MDTELFVSAIRRHVRDAAVEDLINKLKRPPGRRVPPAKKAKTDWFNALSDSDAAHVKQVVEDAVDEAIFGMFAVLDGSRTICDGRFDLTYAGEKRVLLNDPDKIGLNEVFNAKE